MDNRKGRMKIIGIIFVVLLFAICAVALFSSKMINQKQVIDISQNNQTEVLKDNISINKDYGDGVVTGEIIIGGTNATGDHFYWDGPYKNGYCLNHGADLYGTAVNGTQLSSTQSAYDINNAKDGCSGQIKWLLDNIARLNLTDSSYVETEEYNLYKSNLKDILNNYGKDVGKLNYLSDKEIFQVQQYVFWHFTKNVSDVSPSWKDNPNGSQEEAKADLYDALIKGANDNSNYNSNGTEKIGITKDSNCAIVQEGNDVLIGPITISNEKGKKYKLNCSSLHIKYSSNDVSVTGFVKILQSDKKTEINKDAYTRYNGKIYIQIPNYPLHENVTYDCEGTIQAKSYSTEAKYWKGTSSNIQPVVTLRRNENSTELKVKTSYVNQTGSYQISVEKVDESENPININNNIFAVSTNGTNMTPTISGSVATYPEVKITSSTLNDDTIIIREVISPDNYVLYDKEIKLIIKKKYESNKYIGYVDKVYIDGVEETATSGGWNYDNGNVYVNWENGNITVKVKNTKEVDLALKKMITRVAKKGTDEFINVTKDNGFNVDRHNSFGIDCSKLGETETNAVYTMNKTPVEVSKGDKVEYAIRVYNEGKVKAKANQIKDYIPVGLKVTSVKYDNAEMKSYNTNGEEYNNENYYTYDENNGVLTVYLNEAGYINEFNDTNIESDYILVTCEVKNDATGVLTNIAEITEYKTEKGVIERDIDSTSGDWESPNGDDKTSTDKSSELWRNYANEQQDLLDGNWHSFVAQDKGVNGNKGDDDDFDKIIIKPQYSLTIKKVNASDENKGIDDIKFNITRKKSEDNSQDESFQNVETHNSEIYYQEEISNYGEYTITYNIEEVENNKYVQLSEPIKLQLVIENGNITSYKFNNYGGTFTGTTRFPCRSAEGISLNVEVNLSGNNVSVVISNKVIPKSEYGIRLRKISSGSNQPLQGVTFAGQVYSYENGKKDNVQPNNLNLNTTDENGYTNIIKQDIDFDHYSKIDEYTITEVDLGENTGYTKIQSDISVLAYKELNNKAEEFVLKYYEVQVGNESITIDDNNQKANIIVEENGVKFIITAEETLIEGIQTLTITVTNAPNNVFSLYIRKISAELSEEGEEKYIQGTEYTISREGNEGIEVPLYKGIDIIGMLILTDNVEAGNSTLVYKVVEENAAEGYENIFYNKYIRLEVTMTNGVPTDVIAKVFNSDGTEDTSLSSEISATARSSVNAIDLVIKNPEIEKNVDLALKKMITRVAKKGTEEFVDVTKNNGFNVDRHNGFGVDCSELGETSTNAIYTMNKTPVEVSKGDKVEYAIRVYNEGEVKAKANQIKDYIPVGLKVTSVKYNNAEMKSYNTNSEEYNNENYYTYDENNGVLTVYLNEANYIDEFNGIEVKSDYVLVTCEVKNDATGVLTNFAEITEYKTEKGVIEQDIDSTSGNWESPNGDDKTSTDKSSELWRNYANEQQNLLDGNWHSFVAQDKGVNGNKGDDDDFDKIIIKPEYSLTIRKVNASDENKGIDDIKFNITRKKSEANSQDENFENVETHNSEIYYQEELSNYGQHTITYNIQEIENNKYVQLSEPIKLQLVVENGKITGYKFSYGDNSYGDIKTGSTNFECVSAERIPLNVGVNLSGNNVSIVISNKVIPKSEYAIRLRKISSGSNQPLQGVTFDGEIYSYENGGKDEVKLGDLNLDKTDENGYTNVVKQDIDFDNYSKIDEYKITEVDLGANTGYTKIQSDINVLAYKELNNKAEEFVLKYYEVQVGNESITIDDNNQKANIIVEENGVKFIITAEETLIEGIQTLTITVTNAPNNVFSLYIRKISAELSEEGEEKYIQGTEYTIKKENSDGTDVTLYKTTDLIGMLILTDNVEAGNSTLVYKVVEENAAEGYENIFYNKYIKLEVEMVSGVATNVVAKVFNNDGTEDTSLSSEISATARSSANAIDLVIKNPEIKKNVDLALKKMITRVAKKGTEEFVDVTKNNGFNVDRHNEFGIDCSKLGGTNTNAVYTMNKTPVEVSKGDKVEYAIRVYNEGEVKAKANQIKDYIPVGLKVTSVKYNNAEMKSYNTNSEEYNNENYYTYDENNGVLTVYLNEANYIDEFNGTEVKSDYVLVTCEVKNDATGVLTNFAEITEYKTEKGVIEQDIDSTSANWKSPNGDDKTSTDKSSELWRNYANEQQDLLDGNWHSFVAQDTGLNGNKGDDDDFDKIIIKPEYSLTIKKVNASDENKGIDDIKFNITRKKSEANSQDESFENVETHNSEIYYQEELSNYGEYTIEYIIQEVENNKYVQLSEPIKLQLVVENGKITGYKFSYGDNSYGDIKTGSTNFECVSAERIPLNVGVNLSGNNVSIIISNKVILKSEYGIKLRKISSGNNQPLQGVTFGGQVYSYEYGRKDNTQSHNLNLNTTDENGYTNIIKQDIDFDNYSKIDEYTITEVDLGANTGYTKIQSDINVLAYKALNENEEFILEKYVVQVGNESITIDNNNKIGNIIVEENGVKFIITAEETLIGGIQTLTITVTNAPNNVFSLYIRKISAELSEEGEEKYIQGTEYTISREGNEGIEVPLYKGIDIIGMLILTDNVEAGNSTLVYKVVEENAAEGYENIFYNKYIRLEVEMVSGVATNVVAKVFNNDGTEDISLSSEISATSRSSVNAIDLVIKNPETEKVIDLALKKIITKVNGIEVKSSNNIDSKYDRLTEGNDNLRINTQPLKNGSFDAEYYLNKTPILVQKGSTITYQIRIYNEGSEENATASKITDYLPSGLQFVNAYYRDEKTPLNENIDYTYDSNKNVLKINVLENKDLIEKFDNGDTLSYDYVTIECIVTNSAKGVLTNVAEIAEYKTEKGIVETDRDSQSGNWRNPVDGNTSNNETVNRDSTKWTEYEGHINNVLEEGKFKNYKGQQDDDDFEKIIVTTGYTLQLQKVSALDNSKGLQGIDISINGSTYTTDENGFIEKLGPYDLSVPDGSMGELDAYTIDEVATNNENYVKLKQPFYLFIQKGIDSDGTVNLKGYYINTTQNRPDATAYYNDLTNKTATYHTYDENGNIVDIVINVSEDTVNIGNYNIDIKLENNISSAFYDVFIKKVDELENVIDGVKFSWNATTGNNSEYNGTSVTVDGCIHLGKYEIDTESVNKKDIITIDEVEVSERYYKLEDSLQLVISKSINNAKTKYEISNIKLISNGLETEGLEEVVLKNVRLKDTNKTVDIKAKLENDVITVTIENIEKEFDLALKKMITKVAKQGTDEFIDVTKDNGFNVDRHNGFGVDCSELGETNTNAIYTMNKTPVEVSKGDKVEYEIRVYNEGKVKAKANQIKDYIPVGLKVTSVKYNNAEMKSYNTNSEEYNNENYYTYDENNGVLTVYLNEADYIDEFNGTEVKYDYILVTCQVENNATGVLTNIAEITEYKTEKGVIKQDIDSTSANWESPNGDDKTSTDKSSELWRNYANEQQDLLDGNWHSFVAQDTGLNGNKGDDDDFDKIIIKPEYSLTIKKVNASDENKGIDDIKFNITRKKSEANSQEENFQNVETHNSEICYEEEISNYGEYTITYNIQEVENNKYVQLSSPINLQLIVENGKIAGYKFGYGDSSYGDIKTGSSKFRCRSTQGIALDIEVNLSGNNVSIIISNKVISKSEYGIRLRKISSGSNQPLQGVTFDGQVYSYEYGQKDNTQSHNLNLNTTDENGYTNIIKQDIDFDNYSKIDEYTITEVDLGTNTGYTKINSNISVLAYKQLNENEEFILEKYIVQVGNESITIDDNNQKANIIVEENGVTFIITAEEAKIEGIQALTITVTNAPDNEIPLQIRKVSAKDGTTIIEGTEYTISKDGVEVPLYKGIDLTGTVALTDSVGAGNSTVIYKVIEENSAEGYDNIFYNKYIRLEVTITSGVPTDVIAKVFNNDGTEDTSLSSEVNANIIDVNSVKTIDLEIKNPETEKEFDLALYKWVSTVMVTEDGKTTEYESNHSQDDKSNMVNVSIAKNKLDKVMVKFKYQIKVENQGELEGYAKEIKDHIPKGLKFVEEDNTEYGWVLKEDGVITTDYLKDTLLQPGETAEVTVVLTWINAEDNLGQKINYAEISEDYNDYDIPDKDSTPDNFTGKSVEDDEDNDVVILQIRTGMIGIITYVLLGTVAIAVIAIGVVGIKVYFKKH